MNKIAQSLTVAAVAFLLAGCASAPTVNSLVSDNEPAEVTDVQSLKEVAAEELAELVESTPTAPGDICDINSLYTVDCHKQFPEVAYLNGITRNAGEPLASMSDLDKIALGHEACAQMRGGTPEAEVNVIGGSGSSVTNNAAVVGVAIASFCTEFSTSGLFD